jgi:hypothetical protein
MLARPHRSEHQVALHAASPPEMPSAGSLYTGTPAGLRELGRFRSQRSIETAACVTTRPGSDQPSTPEQLAGPLHLAPDDNRSRPWQGAVPRALGWLDAAAAAIQHARQRGPTRPQDHEQREIKLLDYDDITSASSSSLALEGPTSQCRGAERQLRPAPPNTSDGNCR